MLVATAAGAREILPDGLRARGAQVDVVHLYRTVPEAVDAEAVRAADLVTFTSSSTVTSLAAGLGDGGLRGVRAASIGPVTSAALREHGVEPLAEADPHTVEGLVAAVGAAPGRLSGSVEWHRCHRRLSPSCRTSARPTTLPAPVTA